jgi:hypothetical protein
MAIKFNKEKYLKLVSESKNLDQEGKVLEDSKYNELNQYNFLLEDQTFWESKYFYLQIFEDFVNKSIDVD